MSIFTGIQCDYPDEKCVNQIAMPAYRGYLSADFVSAQIQIKESGWKKRQRNNKRYDLCPLHAKMWDDNKGKS